MAKRVSLGADVDIAEEGERLHTAILVKGVVGHINIALLNRLALDTTKMNGRIMLHDIDDREPVHGKQMFMRSIPNSAAGEEL